MGDINGIGAEVMVRALAHADVRSTCRPLVIADRRLLAEYLNALPQDAISGRVDSAMLVIGSTQIPVFNVESAARLQFGLSDPLAGRLAGECVERAVQMANRGQVEAIVTMPLGKDALNAGGYAYPGHTEMLAELSGGAEPLMILQTEGLSVALATVHCPLAHVPSQISADLLMRRIRALHMALRDDFSVASPRIAVLGLNPHAGESGRIGREEITHIIPAVEGAAAAGIEAHGPFSADAFFARYAPGTWDGVLAMYHDQGLIPLKMLARGAGVNITAGLPIVRTSPDHGTAYDIAGRGTADETSAVQAAMTAAHIARNRHQRAGQGSAAPYHDTL